MVEEQRQSTIMGSPLEKAMRELKKAWLDCRPSCASVEQFFHYTLAEGLYGILTTRTLRLSKVSALNDATEMLHGASVIEEVIEKVRSQPEGQNSVLNLDAVVEKGKDFVRKGLVSKSYVACFCEKRDLLSQWRWYGEKGAGFAIGFNRVRLERYLEEFLHNKSLRVSNPMPMVYKKDRQKMAISCFLSKAEEIAAKKYKLTGPDLCKFTNEFGFLLFQFPIGMKKPCFSAEKEWRILQVGRDEKGVKPRPGRGTYLELSGVPPDVFASMTLGTAVDPKFGTEPMKLFLKRNQLEHVKVRRSQVPLRALP